VLFNEPKLLKSGPNRQRQTTMSVSVLFNEPKLLKSKPVDDPAQGRQGVSVLFNEPKLLKYFGALGGCLGL